MTYKEHLDWCKKRAHEYLDKGDVQNAVASMMSDLQKHPETATHAGSILDAIGLQAAISGDAQAARRYIDGFN
jgi:hypothetical protein